MLKRAVAALLWFYAMAWAFNFLAVFAGFPQAIGTGIAAMSGLLVGLDPLALIWSKRITPASEVGDVVRAPAALPGRI